MPEIHLAWCIFLRMVVRQHHHAAYEASALASFPEDVREAYTDELGYALESISEMETALGPCPFRSLVETYFAHHRDDHASFITSPRGGRSLTPYPEPLPWH